jgi:hypothetical protein
LITSAAIVRSAPWIPITLGVEPDSVSYTLWQTDQGVAANSVYFSGFLDAELMMDPVTIRPTNFRFTGGALVYSDSISTYTPFQLPATQELRFTSSGVSGPLVSLATEPSVHPESGLLAAADHVQTLSTGTILTEYRQLIFGNWITLFSDLRDFSEEPQSSPIAGSTRIETESICATELLEILRVTLVHESETTPVTYPLGTGAVTVTGSGGFTASTSITLPSPGLRQWLSASNSNPDEWLRLEDSIYYAIGLSPGLRVTPITIASGDRNEAIIDLPSTGTRAPLLIQYSEDLGNWINLGWPGAGELLPTGAAGLHRIPLPDHNRGFLRLSSVVPGGPECPDAGE